MYMYMKMEQVQNVYIIMSVTLRIYWNQKCHKKESLLVPETLIVINFIVRRHSSPFTIMTLLYCALSGRKSPVIAYSVVITLVRLMSFCP